MNRLVPPLLALTIGLAACSSGDPDITAGDSDPAPEVTAAPFTVSDGIERLSPDPAAPTLQWVDGINSAGWEFHRTLEGNAISSPISLGTAFSLLRAGASEPTDATLDTIFGFPAGNGAHQAANSAHTAVEAANAGETIVEIANQLFVRSEPLQSFTDSAAAHYGAPPVPLAADPDAAANEINGWVKDQTHDLILEIVTPDDVANSAVVIVNTVYLFANWRSPFDATLTAERPFQTANGPVQTDFMAHPKPIPTRYVEMADAVAVELAYADGDLSMWIIVPNQIDGLAAVETSLDAATIANLSDIASEGSVQLSMPKWETELPPTDLLTDWLCPQGLCAGASTDNIIPGTFLEFAFHAAKIIVDEKGTEAAAATAIGADESAPVVDLTVTADRPFTYAIVHEPTKTLLFIGRLTDPTAG